MKPTARELLQKVRDRDHWLRGEFPDIELAARVEKVLALHSESTDFPGTCVACNYAKLPCLTLRRLNGEDN